MFDAATKPSHKPKWSFPDALKVLLGIVVLTVGINELLFRLRNWEVFGTIPHPSLLTLTLLIVQEIIFLAPLYYFVIHKNHLRAADLGFRKMRWKAVLAWVLKGFGLAFLANLGLALIMYYVPDSLPGFSRQESHIPIFGTSALDYSLALIALVGLAPVVEEVFFRGFVLQTLLGKFQPWVASILTAACFALLHFEFGSIGIIAILALILNWIFLRSRSIIPCIAFHMINNALAFLLEWLVWQGYVSL
ncbi:MAG: CPBP family intramembrane glutamic endopeptidase [Patescibacteria group bacterium]